MTFIPINTPELRPNVTPFSSIRDAIMQARKFEMEKEKMRAEILQQQATTKNLQDDNTRADEFLKIAQGNAARAQGTQSADDIQMAYEAAAVDPALANQKMAALGYKLKQQPQANAVDEVLAGPQVQGTGGAGLPQDIFGAPGGESHPDDYGNMMPPAAPDMMGPRPEAASNMAAQQRLATAQGASKRLQYEGPGGRQIEIDPEMAANVYRQKFAEDIEKRTAASGMRVAYQQAEAERKRDFTRDENEKYKNEGLSFDQRGQLIDRAGKYKLGAASISSNPEIKADTANRQDLALVQRAMTNIERTVDWKGLVSSDKVLRSALSNIESPNALLHKDSMVQMARFFRQAMPTEGEMNLLYKNLGGLQQVIPGLWRKMADGDLTHEQIRLITDAARRTRHEFATNRDRALGAIKESFGPGSGYENLRPQINTAIRARAKMVGADDLSLDDPGATGGAVLGSGERPKQAAARQAAAAPTDKGRASKLKNQGAINFVKENENSDDPEARAQAQTIKARLQKMGAM